MLDPRFGTPSETNPIEYSQVPIVSYRNMQEFNYFYNYTVYHREPYQLTIKLIDNIKMFSKTHRYLDSTLVTPFGTGNG